MKKPRVALFSTFFLELSQTFIWEELRAHDRYDVEVFTRRRMNSERFPYHSVHALQGEQASWTAKLSSLAYATTRLSSTFDGIFENHPFDLVHGHFGLGSVYALRYAKQHDLPLVCTFHGYDVPILRDPRRYLSLEALRYSLLAPQLFDRMTLGLCASNDLFQLLVEMGVPEERLAIHRLGVDLDKFCAADATERSDVFSAIMVGRFVEKKGFEYGIRAFAKARALCDTAMHLTIIGEGERRQKLEDLVGALGVSDSVQFTGALTNAQVAERLRRASVLLAPSITAANGNRESGLIVVKEASACEVVPLGTYHGGIPEIIDDGQTGFLVPERDVDSLAERLVRLVRDPALWARLAASAREKMVREYDNVQRVAALEELYDRAREQYRFSANPKLETTDTH